jgi:hypothetical protein
MMNYTRLLVATVFFVSFSSAMADTGKEILVLSVNNNFTKVITTNINTSSLFDNIIRIYKTSLPSIYTPIDTRVDPNKKHVYNKQLRAVIPSSYATYNNITNGSLSLYVITTETREVSFGGGVFFLMLGGVTYETNNPNTHKRGTIKIGFKYSF